MNCLANCYLSEMDLSGIELSGLHFSRLHFSGMDVSRMDVSGMGKNTHGFIGFFNVAPEMTGISRGDCK